MDKPSYKKDLLSLALKHERELLPKEAYAIKYFLEVPPELSLLDLDRLEINDSGEVRLREKKEL